MRFRRQYPTVIMMMASSTWGFQQQLPIIPNSRNLSSFRWNNVRDQQSSRSPTVKKSQNDNNDDHHAIISSMFQTGDPIQVEVIQFGPMGASVDVVGLGHDPNALLDESEPPLGQGLILQKEISYFREARDNLDVVRGEVLPAYVEKVRPEDGKLHIALRQVGGKAKAESVGKMIVDELRANASGTLTIGDKSTPADIAQVFPGVSKGAFKKAISALYKKGIVKPGPNSVELKSK
eukprot:CAMPEP_0194217572 /NCGR_PEP_ID=MMETSP0156-20130528/21654_1 /TAXON_ID=33649 /ORGANISM="Thalassionema nitzschioides, Strain L26-B" /LENGTH=234 /DNA_ID=CAMNT_0038946657 /DNA_START=35 /DNA_END=739 /DNA_ORIENTATION=+